MARPFAYHARSPQWRYDMFSHLEVDIDLQLKAVTPEDAAALFALVDANRSYLRQWLPWLDFNTEVAHSAAFIAESCTLMSAGTGLVSLIYHQGELVGTIGYNSIDREISRAEIGYWLAQHAQGRGIMTRCAAALTAYAFDTLDLETVHIAAAVENLGSRAIPERLGFEYTGIKADAEELYGRKVDHAVYLKHRVSSS